MELEAIGRVTVGDHGLEIGRQIDDVDSIEGALLGADTASNTQTFRNEGDARLGSHFDAELASSHHWARLFAFLTTFLTTFSILSSAFLS